MEQSQLEVLLEFFKALGQAERLKQVLARHYPDYALLRRYLVDNRVMQRASSFYWRPESA